MRVDIAVENGLSCGHLIPTLRKPRRVGHPANNTPPAQTSSTDTSQASTASTDPNQQKNNKDDRGKPDDKKKADDQIRGRLKKSKSYASDYGDKTYGEIKELAKQGDPKAKAMKKLIEQSARLMEKVSNK